MTEFRGFTGPFCPDCAAHMSPLVLSPTDPVIVGYDCSGCGLVELTERGESEAADV